MSTSLSEQLRRLAVPQTGVLHSDLRKTASIIFDPKEAATKDRRTIYELGLSGLQELTSINPNFQQFESTLFNEATLQLERAVEQSDVNRVLDLNITKFFQHLSPYFLLRPAHLCIEWLLRRFHVHEYNQSALIALILPYHETNVFVQVLQTMRFRRNDAEWEWLRPLQKPGVPLAKSAIVNRAATTPAFFKFVCHSTIQAIEELGPRAYLLQAVINFYATIVVGTLQNAHPVQEWHISTLLESLLKGLSSEFIDITSAAYIIAAQLVARVQLKPKLSTALVERVASCSFERLRTTAILLLVWIFDSQAGSRPLLSEKSLNKLVSQRWVTETLANLSKENLAIHTLIKPLVEGGVAAIQKDFENTVNIQQFFERLIVDINFSKSNASQLINCFLDSFVAPVENGKSSFDGKMDDDDVIELDSDDDMSNGGGSFLSWYSAYLFKLERHYPEAFDYSLKMALQTRNDDENDSSNRNKAIKMALGFRLKSSDSNAQDIYQCIYHYTAQVRLHAIKTLLGNLKNYQTRTQNYQLLKECLADRIDDDSELVVAEILKLPTKDFIEILGAECFAQALFRVLHKTQWDHKRWSPLIKNVVQHLVSKVLIEQYDNNLILLALMPLIFPAERSTGTHAAILEILNSELCKQIHFLNELKVCADFRQFDITEHKKHFLNIIASTVKPLSALDLLKSIDQSGGEAYFKESMQVTHLLVLLTAGLRQQFNAAECLNIYETITAYTKKFQLTNHDNTQSQNVPLQLYSDFLLLLTRQTSFDQRKLVNWDINIDNNTDLLCFIRIFDNVSNEVFNATNTDNKLAWGKTLKVCLDSVFSNAQLKMDFLLNFYTNNELPLFTDQFESYQTLRLRAFKLLQSVLRNAENKLEFKTAHILRVTCALSSQSHTIRSEALETLDFIAKRSEKLEQHIKYFNDAIISRRNELIMDHEQFALILFTILQPSSKQQQPQAKANAAKLQREILEHICSTNQQTSSVFIISLLQALKHLNDEYILATLLPLAETALKHSTKAAQITMLQSPHSDIYQLIVERFESHILNNLLTDNPAVWQLFEKSFDQHDVYIMFEGKLQPIACVILSALTPQCFDKLPAKYKLSLLQLIIKNAAQSDNDSTFLAAHKLLKKCSLDCRMLVEIVQRMYQQEQSVVATRLQTVKPTERKKINITTHIDLNRIEWKQGVVLLELLEHKKHLNGAEYLIPTLFELLKACLDLEEQGAAEYAKQLILSNLLHCCQSAQADQVNLQTAIPKSSFRIEHVVQCLRVTQNPQTQQSALLLLVHCAGIFPQQVLHNIVAIFTFMGCSVVRHDDAFSFHIIDKIIESIVPILIEQPENTQHQREHVIPVLKVFSDIMLDVPEHRRLPLYTKLLQTLDTEQHLWQFLCVVFEAHILEDEAQRAALQQAKTNQGAKQHQPTSGKRIEIALELMHCFDPKIIIETCVQLLDYIQQLPMNSDRKTTSNSSLINVAETSEACLFNVQCRTSKQLRHFKYIIMQFLSSLSSSKEFLNKLGRMQDAELSTMKPYYQNFIIKTLSYVAIVNNAIKTTTDSSHTKFWKVILHHVHDVLDNAISLLSPELFLVVVNGLMQHKLLSVRKKVIELLISKLQQQQPNPYFDNCNSENFYNLFKPLSDIVAGILDTPENAKDNSPAIANELIFIQQTALIAIKLLSKLFGLQYIDEFKSLLVILTQIMKKRAAISKIVVATVVLTLIEISANLKAHSLAQLPKYMPLLVDVLQDQADFVRQHSPDNISLAVVAAVQKLFESLPLFLGPYIVDIITTLTTISSHITAHHNTVKDERAANVQQKIEMIWSKIASEVPVRILMPSCEKAYKKLMATKQYDDIGVLMKLLLASIKHKTNAELNTLQLELSDFFLNALEFRLQLQGNNKVSTAQIALIESTIIDAFVAWILKLSETSFRPMYNKVYVWAFKRTEQKATQLTYFLLTNKIAEALKSLFVLFASNFIEDAARLLNASNTAKQSINSDDQYIHIELISAILSTLYNIFLYDSKDFVNTQRFNILMLPIVDQLENNLVLENESLQASLTACIAQLAVAVSSDVLWKQLNYQVLLKTRTSVSEVRIFSFNCCVEIARKLGDDFTTLLPETVPFIAELFEDENSRVEQNTRNSVRELESILGESLQKYL